MIARRGLQNCEQDSDVDGFVDSFCRCDVPCEVLQSDSQESLFESPGTERTEEFEDVTQYGNGTVDVGNSGFAFDKLGFHGLQDCNDGGSNGWVGEMERVPGHDSSFEVQQANVNGMAWNRNPERECVCVKGTAEESGMSRRIWWMVTI